MINPKAYRDFVEGLETAMGRARALGLFRTTEKLHAALNEARAEQFEALPPQDVTIEFTAGPVREQQLPKPSTQGG
jgi:hypothetical protein